MCTTARQWPYVIPWWTLQGTEAAHLRLVAQVDDNTMLPVQLVLSIHGAACERSDTGNRYEITCSTKSQLVIVWQWRVNKCWLHSPVRQIFCLYNLKLSRSLKSSGWMASKLFQELSLFLSSGNCARMEMVLKILVYSPFNHLIQLIAQKNFIKHSTYQTLLHKRNPPAYTKYCIQIFFIVWSLSRNQKLEWKIY